MGQYHCLFDTGHLVSLFIELHRTLAGNAGPVRETCECTCSGRCVSPVGPALSDLAASWFHVGTIGDGNPVQRHQGGYTEAPSKPQHPALMPAARDLTSEFPG